MSSVQRLLGRARYSSSSIHDQGRQCFVSLDKSALISVVIVFTVDGLAEVVLNRPERKNAFGRQLVGELQEAIAFLKSSP